MRDPSRDDRGPRLDPSTSRRRFLRGATGVAGASVAALVTASGARTWSAAAEPPQGPQSPEALRGPQAPQSPQPVRGPVGDPVLDCCGHESAIPLMGAALFRGSYVGLASSPSGPGLFTLNLDAGQRVSLGASIAVDLPAGFVVSSLGVARGRLVLSGGLPFLWDSYEVDDTVSADVRAVMEVIPQGLGEGGTRRIDVMGVQPAAFFVDPPFVEPVSLPAMPRRAFAVAGAVAETTSGALTLLIEHSDGFDESYYAAAVELLEQSLSGTWAVRSAMRGLGESGPNFLATDGDEVAVGLNTTEGATLVWPSSASLASTARSRTIASRMLALVPGAGGLNVVTGDRSASRRWSVTTPDGSWRDTGAMGVDGEALVGAVAVAGAPGQSILLGRRSARLVDDVRVQAGRIEGGVDHVL